MWRATRLVLASKKRWRLKCSQCLQLLPAEHFKRVNVPMHTLTCLDCKQMCVVCGIRHPRENFSDPSGETCDQCLAKEAIAAENVYYRFPVLKYRSCPFSTEQAREDVRQDRNNRRW